jgi:hypothetical protein
MAGLHSLSEPLIAKNSKAPISLKSPCPTTRYYHRASEEDPCPASLLDQFNWYLCVNV